MIRLSLLPTGHPTGFQPRRVRTSTQFNPRFILPMGSSRSFGSTTSDNCALFRLGFPVASVRKTLTEPLTVTRRIIMQKARRQAFSFEHSPPTACRHMVSGSLSSARRGSSHLSIALLSSLSVVRKYLALQDGPCGFNRDFTWPDLLRYPSGVHIAFTYWTVTTYGRPFHAVRLASGLVTPM